MHGRIKKIQKSTLCKKMVNPAKQHIDRMKTLAYIIVVNVNGNVIGNGSDTVIGNVHRLGW